MPRTNPDGRELHLALEYALNRRVQIRELTHALGVVRNTFTKRSAEPDFPNAQECLLVGKHFGIPPLVLMLEFGVISPAEIEEVYRISKMDPLLPGIRY